MELEEAVTLVGEEMNKNLHQLASQLMTKPFDYRTIDINKLTESANPQLWKLITLMTASKSRGHVQRQKEWDTLPSYTKMRQFYCMCTLLFCTNNQCCMPIHLLLTDVVKANGGSSELIKVPNRLGAIASEDTHHHHHHCYATNSTSHSPHLFCILVQIH